MAARNSELSLQGQSTPRQSYERSAESQIGIHSAHETLPKERQRPTYCSPCYFQRRRRLRRRERPPARLSNARASLRHSPRSSFGHALSISARGRVSSTSKSIDMRSDGVCGVLFVLCSVKRALILKCGRSAKTGRRSKISLLCSPRFNCGRRSNSSLPANPHLFVRMWRTMRFQHLARSGDRRAACAFKRYWRKLRRPVQRT